MFLDKQPKKYWIMMKKVTNMSGVDLLYEVCPDVAAELTQAVRAEDKQKHEAAMAEQEQKHEAAMAAAMVEQRQKQIRVYAASIRSLSRTLGVSPDVVLKGMSLDDSIAGDVRRCLEEDGKTAD